MPDYKQSKIYTITCEDGAVYVGRTITTLEQRLAVHKSAKNCSIYNHIHTNYNDDWSKSKMELYENYPCNSKKELEKKEGEIIRLIGTINRIISGRTRKEWCEDNKEKKNTYYKIWSENNKEYLKEYEQTPNRKERRNIRLQQVIECDCGCLSTKGHIARHIKTKRHQDLMENQINSILLFLECF